MSMATAKSVKPHVPSAGGQLGKSALTAPSQGLLTMAAAFSNVPQGHLNFRMNVIYATTPAKNAKEMSLPTVLPVE